MKNAIVIGLFFLLLIVVMKRSGVKTREEKIDYLNANIGAKEWIRLWDDEITTMYEYFRLKETGARVPDDIAAKAQSILVNYNITLK